MAKKRKKRGKARRRTTKARRRAPAAPKTRWRTRRAPKKAKRRRRRGVGGSYTRTAKTAATTAAALGVTALLVSGFGNRLLAGMFATPTTRAIGKAAVALGAGYALWKLKARKAAGVVMTAGVAASVMEITGTVAGPQIDRIMANVPALKGLTGGPPPAAAAPAAVVAGVGQAYPVTRLEDPIFRRPF